MEWSLYSKSRWSEPWRYQFLTIGLALWLGALCIAGLTYVLSSEPSVPISTLAVAKVAGTLQPTHSLPSPSPQGADSTLIGTELGPPSGFHPNNVVNDQAATAAITVPANPQGQSTPNGSTVAKGQEYKEVAPATPIEAVEKTLPEISAFERAELPPDAPAPEEQLSDAERELFTQRGNELLAAGDIASARLFFERAADAGDVRSALGMAKTFDPVELARAGVRGLKSDPAKADYWYQRAHSLAGDRNFDRPVKDNRRD